MNPKLNEAAQALRSALEAQADLMSAAAQMALDALEEGRGHPNAHKGLVRVQANAQAIYSIVHEQITAQKLATTKAPIDEQLQVIRHELRNLIQKIMWWCEIIVNDQTLPSSMRGEVAAITERAIDCVQALDSNRQAMESDVTLHLRAVDSPTTFHDDKLCIPAQILVVDDRAESCDLLKRFLERDNHEVTCAYSGREALHFTQSREFDLILLDIDMPDLNGFQVMEALRMQGVLRHTAVILVSGLDSQAHAIRGLELGAEDLISRPVDLKLLRARMKASLDRQRLREIELAQFFTPTLARHLRRNPELLATGRKAIVTVLFCDIVGFSRISEQLGPIDTIRWVGAVLGAMSSCVTAEDGVLVDYSGDQIMALWGTPQDHPDHADRACRCAQAMMDQLPALNAVWRDIVGEETTVTIGINTGEAFVGNIGTSQKFKFGALGNTVNLASRVQSAAKTVRAKVMFTGWTKQYLQSNLPSRCLGKVRVNNIQCPVELHELYSETHVHNESLIQDYERALSFYEEGRVHDASAQLANVISRFPLDGPSLLLLSRTVQEMLRDDKAGFDPVWTLLHK